MTVTLRNTTKIVELNIPGQGIFPARIWEGETDTGIKVHAYITRIAVKEGENQAQFQRELQECAKPSAELEAIPLRLVL